MKTFYVSVKKDEETVFVPVEGDSFPVPGYEEFCFFLHREIVNANGLIGTHWHVSEATTGRMAAYGVKKHTAVIQLLQNLSKITPEKFKKTIQALWDDGKVSPYVKEVSHAPH